MTKKDENKGISELGPISEAIHNFKRPEASKQEIIRRNMIDLVNDYVNQADIFQGDTTYSERLRDFYEWLGKEGFLSFPDTARKTYVIFSDPYMQEEYDVEEFKGTYRQLLEHVNDVTDENRDELFFVPGVPPNPVLPGTESKISDLSNDDLVRCFNYGNGDGQPYYVVWCVEDHKKVLG